MIIISHYIARMYKILSWSKIWIDGCVRSIQFTIKWYPIYGTFPPAWLSCGNPFDHNYRYIMDTQAWDTLNHTITCNEHRTFHKFSHNNAFDDAFPGGSSHPSRKMAPARGRHARCVCASPRTLLCFYWKRSKIIETILCWFALE